jgi:hypothetical protein
MLQWGINKADKLGVKMVVEATVQGQQFYQRFGFVTKEILDMKKEGMEGDDEWMELEKRFPLVCCWMVRAKKAVGV